ncbi:uncharacterized protein LOC123658624 [Melitaea cinxia]|uniref:uncharacterized protein LOC123658624 n=1 Tax=Melitaea cinxia TaxID=113334 RepID=UPI001E272680|nr:uncharacterized protein LOC123658624 [Melitaea cinxia]
MSTVQIWSIVVIFCQTLISVIISWWTLDCRFVPNSSELHEITLMKLLYLYDPEACGRIHFYNVTIVDNYDFHSTVIWPIKNKSNIHMYIRFVFHRKIRLWLSVHVIWLLLSIVNFTHGRRPCGFYAVVLPFTGTGIASLIIDLIYTGIFLSEINVTNTEIAILLYISEPGALKWINKPFPWQCLQERDEDTSWISLLFAYISCRGIVQWFVNFWLIKDNYFEGLAAYHRLQKEKSRTTSRA